MIARKNPDELFALWTQLACGICNTVYRKLFSRFASFREIYECEDFSFLEGKHNCERALRQKDLDKAYELQKLLHERGYHVLTYHESRYPASLRTLAAPPAVLYAIGDLRNLNDMVGVAVVGTRNMTSYGASVAEDFAFRLATCGVTIVSGLAKGIDTCAHRGAVRAGSYTIGVLGTPIDVIYPKENAKAFQALYKRGLVISEMYPGCKRTKGDFPNRNRIISGLTQATVVVEAGETSGALITAKHAIYQNKLVFAVPGALGDAHAGTNKLIKQGIPAATDASDILDALSLSHPVRVHPDRVMRQANIYAYGNAGIVSEEQDEPFVPTDEPAATPEPKPQKQPKPKTNPPQTIAEKIIDALQSAPLTADELADRLHIGVTELLSELTMLEIEGSVRASAGNRFTVKN